VHCPSTRLPLLTTIPGPYARPPLYSSCTGNTALASTPIYQKLQDLTSIIPGRAHTTPPTTERASLSQKPEVRQPCCATRQLQQQRQLFKPCYVLTVLLRTYTYLLSYSGHTPTAIHTYQARHTCNLAVLLRQSALHASRTLPPANTDSSLSCARNNSCCENTDAPPLRHQSIHTTHKDAAAREAAVADASACKACRCCCCSVLVLV